MFDNSDFKLIDKDYFDVISTTGYHIIIKSRDTKHVWDIYFQDLGTNWTYVVSHKHKDSEPFHIQAGFHPHSITEAQELIKAHDKWHKGGRKKE